MKIKVFKFKVSNGSSNPLDGDGGSRWFREQASQLVPAWKIEEIINEFCCDKNVIDIKVNHVDINYHNNARGNTVELWYTIMYKEV